MIAPYLAGYSKRPSRKAAASEGPEAYPLGYVEALNDARTLLADFFSVLPSQGCELSDPFGIVAPPL